MTLALPDLSGLGLTARRLQPTDRERLIELCRSCSEFFELVAGESGPSKTADNLLEKRPPGVDPRRKYLLGVERGDRLVGVIDLIDGYPAKHDWYVGTLLLLPEERARGTGRAIWSATEIWVRSLGGRVVRLIVQEQNPRAADFWASLGFVSKGQVPQYLETRTNACWSYVKELGATTET
jgi:ribosomal protein S18 acetylase RimI-like enzyme